MEKIIEGSINLKELCLTELCDLSDVELTENFYCFDNYLTNLKGAPTYVGGDFLCNNNDLTSLVGSPSAVGGEFNCTNNKLTSLKGAPITVGGEFNCMGNILRNLNDLPKTIGGDLLFEAYIKEEFPENYVRSRCEIKGTVHYFHTEVDDDINNGEIEEEEMNHVNLTNLNLTKLPDLYKVEVTGNCFCNDNNLTDLVGAPKTVGKTFSCDGNDLTSLKGIPTSIGGGFWISKELKDKFPEEYIRSLSDIEGSVRYI